MLDSEIHSALALLHIPAEAGERAFSAGSRVEGITTVIPDQIYSLHH